MCATTLLVLTHTRMHNNNIITIYTQYNIIRVLFCLGISGSRLRERPSAVHLYLPAMAFEEFTRTINFCRGSRSPHYIIILSSSYTYVVQLRYIYIHNMISPYGYIILCTSYTHLHNILYARGRPTAAKPTAVMHD